MPAAMASAHRTQYLFAYILSMKHISLRRYGADLASDDLRAHFARTLRDQVAVCITHNVIISAGVKRVWAAKAGHAIALMCISASNSLTNMPLKVPSFL